MRDFKSLQIWQNAHELAKLMYQLTAHFPANEKFGLIPQIRRCCTSIPTNIAEGCGRDSNPEMKRFLVIANGSCSELHYHLIFSHDLHYITSDQYKELEMKVILLKKMIYMFIKNLPT